MTEYVDGYRCNANAKCNEAGYKPLPAFGGSG